ncbi:MAG TPA: DJ-1/PfpI family protein [Azospirillaceae bacterium]|nr:DJ-1/PfpI family protein [Azospirillaceae bacterium]
MAEKKVLIVATSHGEMGNGEMGGAGHPTGVWLEELAVPYYVLRDGGVSVTLASVRGGPIPFDPRSMPDGGQDGAQDVPEAVRRFLRDGEALEAARASRPLDEVAGEPFDALFLPGGHGTMWDLPASDTLALLVGSYIDDGRIVAAVCHGPAGLVRAVRGDGRPVVEGRRVSAFTNGEEHAVGLADTVPFLLEDRLRELGADFQKGPDWQPFAVRDGHLITGQNPQSSQLVAETILAALGIATGEAERERLVRERAYEIWESEGRPHGRHEEHWQRAHAEVGAIRDTGLGDAAAAIRDANAPPGRTRGVEPGTVVEGGSAEEGGPTLGGAGTSGDLVTPRP